MDLCIVIILIASAPESEQLFLSFELFRVSTYSRKAESPLNIVLSKSFAMSYSIIKFFFLEAADKVSRFVREEAAQIFSKSVFEYIALMKSETEQQRLSVLNSESSFKNAADFI